MEVQIAEKLFLFIENNEKYVNLYCIDLNMKYFLTVVVKYTLNDTPF